MSNKAAFFSALGDETRLRIVDYLLKREECTCVCELSELLKKDQSVISRHLKILKDAGIIEAKKDSRYLICCIKEKNRIKMILEG